MQSRICHLATTGLLAAVLLAACSSDEPAETDPTADTASDRVSAEATDETSAAPPAEDTATRTGDAEKASVIDAADSDLGTILVNDSGMTLYLFTQDSPGESVCVAECLETWQIVEGEPTAGDGVDPALLGSIERDDGMVQATYAESPLYSYIDDFRPGDLTGQDVGAVWYVVSPEGEPITNAPPPSTG